MANCWQNEIKNAETLEISTLIVVSHEGFEYTMSSYSVLPQMTSRVDFSAVSASYIIWI